MVELPQDEFDALCARCSDPLVNEWWKEYTRERNRTIASAIPPSFAEFVSRCFVKFTADTGHYPPVEVHGMGELWKCAKCNMWTPPGGTHICFQEPAEAVLTNLPRRLSTTPDAVTSSATDAPATPYVPEESE